MSRTWAELLGDEEARGATRRSGRGFFSRLRDSLGKSRRALTAELGASFDPAEEEAWERLEVALIRADVGVTATAELVRRLEARGELGDLGDALADEVETLFGEPPSSPSAARRPDRRPRRRRQRHREDDDDRQARAQARASTAAPCSSARRTRSAPPPRSSSRSGPSAPAPTSSAARAGPTRRRSPSTPSRPAGRAAATS